VPEGDARTVARPEQVGASSASGAVGEEMVRQVVRACYRVLLLREPEPAGLTFYAEQIRGGRPIEAIMQQLLRSEEFARRHTKFLRTYVPAVCEAAAEPLIFVHSHRRSGTHFLLDTLRAWFDLPDRIEEIRGETLAPKYENCTLSKDHEPLWGFKLGQRHIWETQEQWRRGCALYEAGKHVYIVRNPLHVLRSAYIFDTHGAEPGFAVDPATTFLAYVKGGSLHERSGGRTRAEYWAAHVKAWYFDERVLVVHYDDLKRALPQTLRAVADHIGLPARETPRAVTPTGIATNLTSRVLAEGRTVAWDVEVVAEVKAAIDRVFGPPPWRGLEARVAEWLN
jgi:hypothetical protein